MPWQPAPMVAQWQQAMNLAHFSSLGCFSWCHNIILHAGQSALLPDRRSSLPLPNTAPQPLCLSVPRTFS